MENDPIEQDDLIVLVESHMPVLEEIDDPPLVDQVSGTPSDAGDVTGNLLLKFALEFLIGYLSNFIIIWFRYIYSFV